MIIHNIDDNVSVGSNGPPPVQGLADIPQDDDELKTLSHEGRGEKHAVGQNLHNISTIQP